LRENDQPTAPTVHRKSRQEKVGEQKQNPEGKNYKLSPETRANDDSRPGVERRELRAGPRELGSVVGGGLDHSPPGLHREKRGEEEAQARGSFFRYFFCFSLGRHQPDTTVSTARQGAGAAAAISIHPSGRVHALTPIFLRARARVCACAVARSLGNATRAAGSPPDSAGVR